ncbi:MAG: cytochrome c, partial [Pseudoalteromonas tetraodonis]|nr:cytochrome c [Pseudoalteromonas tetraodonis]
EYLVAQMKDIKSGARNNGMSMAMKAMVATVTDEEFEAIADYLSKVQ